MKRQFKLMIFFILALFIFIGCKKESDPEITVTDIDGNVYHGVIIGTQTWMVENLKTTQFNDGTQIPNVTDNTEWESITTEAYCNYDHSESNAEIYGRLYNWYAVSSGKLAPEGWHVATDAEWTILIEHVGGLDVAGGRLKEKGITHWTSPNTGADDSYGFKALPGGMRYFNGYFTEINDGAVWWTSSEEDDTFAWFRSIDYEGSSIRRDVYGKKDGFSVRCVKD